MDKNTSTTAGVHHDTFSQLRAVLSVFPKLELAMVFGSIARGCERPDSDVDLAVATSRALTAAEKIALGMDRAVIDGHIVHSIASRHLADFSEFAKSVLLECVQSPRPEGKRRRAL